MTDAELTHLKQLRTHAKIGRVPKLHPYLDCLTAAIADVEELRRLKAAARELQAATLSDHENWNRCWEALEELCRE